jgi:hypothetical protein
MSNSNPWELKDERGSVFGYFLIVLILGGLITLFRSCDFKPADFSAKPVKVTSYKFKPVPEFSGKRFAGKNWGYDKTWRSMDKYQMVAAMAILETKKNKDGSFCIECSKNIVHSIINRASLDGDKLEDSVSNKIYQPVIEPYQYKVLSRYVGSKEHKELSHEAFKRHTGQIKDRVKGATHYLVHSRVMVALQRKQPCKYWSWGPFKCNGKTGSNWTGYNPSTKQYKNQVLVDSDHAFLAPQGRHSAK